MLPKSSDTSHHKLPSQPLTRRIWLAIRLALWVVFGFYLSQLLLAPIIILADAIGIPIRNINTALLSTVVAGIVYIFSAVIVIGLPKIMKKSETSSRELGLHRLPTWQDILFALGGFALYFIITGVLITLAGNLIPGFNPEEVQDVGFEDLTRQYEYVLAFVTLVVIAPVAEEVLMRGYLYGKLRRFLPIIVSTLVTAIAFAFLHLAPEADSSGFRLTQWNVALDVFALSLVLTSLREITGSIWSCILVHMMKNGLAFYFLFINTSMLQSVGG